MTRYCGVHRGLRLYFNPHHHAGGDLTILLNHMPLLYFNPHHHAGGDSKEVYYSRVYTISIHTTTQVVTIRNSQMAEDIKISIHTTTQVVTIFSRSVNERWIISIHTTTQVVTEPNYPGWVVIYHFNPHHHAGGDPINTLATATLFQFQSTPPRRW